MNWLFRVAAHMFAWCSSWSCGMGKWSWAPSQDHRRGCPLTPEPGHRRSALAGFGVSEQLVGRRELLVARGAHEAAGLHGAGSFGKRSHTHNARAVGEASRRDQCFFGRSCCVYSCANHAPHGQSSPLSGTPVPSPVPPPVPSWYCDLPRSDNLRRGDFVPLQ